MSCHPLYRSVTQVRWQKLNLNQMSSASIWICDEKVWKKMKLENSQCIAENLLPLCVVPHPIFLPPSFDQCPYVDVTWSTQLGPKITREFSEWKRNDRQGSAGAASRAAQQGPTGARPDPGQWRPQLSLPRARQGPDNHRKNWVCHLALSQIKSCSPWKPNTDCERRLQFLFRRAP